MKKYDKMKKYAVMNGAAGPARADGSCMTCDQMRTLVSDANRVSLRAQHRDNKNRQGPGHVTTDSQGRRERPVSTVATSNGAPHSHRRSWSADLCKSGTSPVIIVRKNKKEPQPPQRGASLLQLHTASHPSVKRYSCPPIGAFGLRSPPSSSSSSSSTSSCSSPPPVPTSVITGPDPLGWKLQPKSSSSFLRTHSKRLSLQIPLPVIFPDTESSPAPNSLPDNNPNPDPAPRTKPPLRPKPPRRRHSDSSAFLRSLATPLPVVTVEALQAMHLRPLSLSDEPEDVFSEGKEEEAKQGCVWIPAVTGRGPPHAFQAEETERGDLRHHNLPGTDYSTCAREETLRSSRCMKLFNAKV
ncbi:hypothetical protein L3Q82_001096 [Scortum barcoo]|uniref:Uncharacterized protein n=1 Tax=Scortum barcoo TaxID=214431 RepID=A0ACB8WAK0_9TELE|nr:hypothetical protein L3Q82_001096 [Scortum barcoo]